MSASEKLKALEARLRENGRGGDDVLAALPEIVAVVEAAERAVRWESATRVGNAGVLWTAITALDEAL